MLQYIKGDATAPVGNIPKIIPHCCNDVGRFGAGFAAAVAKRWPTVKDLYLGWYRSNPTILSNDSNGACEVSDRMSLGETQIIKVEPDIWVVNIIGQHGTGMGSGGRPPVRYDALKKGFAATCRWAHIHEAGIHMPRVGAGLAGGHWGNIENIIKLELVNRGIEVTVYDL
jgi:O-acetyl-ADP-ribose deacetylase (regulator of RNase III)